MSFVYILPRTTKIGMQIYILKKIKSKSKWNAEKIQDRHKNTGKNTQNIDLKTYKIKWQI